MSSLQKIHVPSQPLVENVCGQMLREVERNVDFSIAHVAMNPGEISLLHRHRKTTEVYAITKGCGEICVDREAHSVKSGAVMLIQPGRPHQLANTGVTSLEHLVLAAPPFDPNDVLIPDDQKLSRSLRGKATIPPPVECFDGTVIFPYELVTLDLSLAFGLVMNDPKRHKPAHHHIKTSEWLYIVEGAGAIEIDGNSFPVRSGDWIRVAHGQKHALRNIFPEHMLVLCICSPCLDMSDVYFED